MGNSKSRTGEKNSGKTLADISNIANAKKDLLDINIGGYEKPKVFDFEKKMVKNWDKNDLEGWLTAIGYKENQLEQILDYCTSGEQLMNLKPKEGKRIEQMELISECSKRDKRKFAIYLTAIQSRVNSKRFKSDNYFSMDFHRVMEKMEKVKAFNFNDLSFHNSKIACNSNILSSPDLTELHFLNAEMSEEKKNLKVKLIITENVFDVKNQFLRKIVSPIASILPGFKQKFGLFHTALMIGDSLYLQWTTTGIIVPKKIESGSAFISLDTNPLTIETKSSFKSVKRKLAEVIVKWNSHMTYDSLSATKKNKGNCQDFVLDVCNELDIDIDYEDDCFSDYLRKIRQKGEYKIQFKPCKEFIENFKLLEYINKLPQDKFKKKSADKIKFHFDTHKELDDFAHYCYMIDREGTKKFKSEYRLLKSFDRAFWLRHLARPKEETWKPAEVEQGRKYGMQHAFLSGCPFFDPRSTGSYSGE